MSDIGEVLNRIPGVTSVEGTLSGWDITINDQSVYVDDLGTTNSNEGFELRGNLNRGIDLNTIKIPRGMAVQITAEEISLISIVSDVEDLEAEVLRFAEELSKL